MFWIKIIAKKFKFQRSFKENNCKNSPTTTKTKIIDIDTNQKLLGIYNFKDEEIKGTNHDKLIKLFNETIKNIGIDYMGMVYLTENLQI